MTAHSRRYGRWCREHFGEPSRPDRPCPGEQGVPAPAEDEGEGEGAGRSGEGERPARES
ncbi:hypothetical protein [Amycolatopsis samaneae]|uniref:Uncharacterized protein n=1 Tax=Amycolatopsis samaneae TaxID=664691 RepID=A0ABW5GUL6_9PSEU